MTSVKSRPLAHSAAAARAASTARASAKKQPMHLAFDVYLDLVNTPQARTRLLGALAGQLKRGDTVWLALEGFTVAKNPASLDLLAKEKQRWVAALEAQGVTVKTRIRFERIHTDPQGSIRPGLADTYESVLKARKAAGLPIADSISYDYEAFKSFTGSEYTPRDTANAARLFAQGQRIAKELGASYFVEPSVSGRGDHSTGIHRVTLDWNKLSRFTDGFNFQTQRIVSGTSKNPGDSPSTIARDRRMFGTTVGQLAEGITRHKGDKAWVMAQLSTEWSRPETVVAAAAQARAQAPDLKSFYIWWYDTGRTGAENAKHLLDMIKLWNETFHRG